MLAPEIYPTACIVLYCFYCLKPFNLINCIGKLVEKVVADELQEAGLFHKGQYGGIKGRSALEAMTRALTQAQRALARGGQVLWVMEDIKGGFNNV